jgi:hypothetical protein
MSNDTEAREVVGDYLVWMWQHYALSMFPCDSLEEAVRLSEAIQDNGDGSPECIEGPEGVVSEEAVEAIVVRLRAAERAERAAAPKHTHFITIEAPTGGHAAQYDWYTSPQDAEAAYARLRERFGDRVSLVETRA